MVDLVTLFLEHLLKSTSAKNGTKIINSRSDHEER